MADTKTHSLRATSVTLAVLSALVLVLLVRNRADLKVPGSVAKDRDSAPPVASTFKTEDELAREFLEKAAQHPAIRVTAQTVPMWVVMQNSEPIPGSFYQPGQRCFIVEDEVAELLAREKDHLVLRYAPIQYRRGSTCQKGTIFYLRLKQPT